MFEFYLTQIKPLADELDELLPIQCDLALCSCGCGKLDRADDMIWQDDEAYINNHTKDDRA